jgi:GNAT superfamily N-acetyltransferase
MPTTGVVYKVEKSPAIGMGLEYSVRLAPYNIARVRLERLSAQRIFVHWVYVPPAFRACGIGGVLLTRVLRDADREGLTVSLVARACGTMAQAPLESWYGRFGFRPRGLVPEGGRAMVRPAAARAATARSRRLRVA